MRTQTRVFRWRGSTVLVFVGMGTTLMSPNRGPLWREIARRNMVR